MTYLWILLLFLPIDCWQVYHNCQRLSWQREFTVFMTGPSGELKIWVQKGNRMSLVPIRPSDLWLTYALDLDKDGDIDLFDYSLRMIENE